MDDDMMEKIENAKKDYYTLHGKNIFQKNQQKLDCAKHITKICNLDIMIQRTIFIIPNTNCIFYDYLMFKLCASEETFALLYERMLNLIQIILSTYDTFELHINLKTFSVSACQRYYVFIANTLNQNETYLKKMNKIIIYYTPRFIDNITQLLYASVKDILHKVVYVKESSEQDIRKLLSA
jgi:hypothetical protein